ncbi:MAG: hypothetical protein KDD47_12075, partial [Acidobacteria bacterium]|nr:hypothetical protein [Acidobacteriota bacterium]
FETPEVSPQYREGAFYNGQRLCIHDFESPQPLDPSYIGPVHAAPAGSAHVEDLLTYPAPFSGNVSTEAVVVPLGTEREAELRFGTGRFRNFSPYSYLSLRLGKPVLKLPGGKEADCQHADPGDLSVRVVLTDSDDQQHEVETTDYQRVADADIHWYPGGFGGIPSCQGNVYLTTVRIPLLDFWQGGVDPYGVKEVALYFDRVLDDGYVHEVLVDSVELTINDLDPHCGNGVVESPEVCDLVPPAGQSCLDYGFVAGDLACSSACLPDTSGCIAPVCGNGVVERDEECDDGNLSPYDECNPDCTACPPGEPLCRCLGSEPGEEDPNLPFDGVLGDGTYCNDDVLYEGLNRCVQMVGGKQACIPCTVSNGPFYPCDPYDDSCFAGFDGAFATDISSPNAPGDAWMTCTFGLKDPNAPGGLDPALTFGYCFAEGETESQGGAPPWFLDWYCQRWYEDAVFQFDPGLGNLCILP